MRRFGCYLRKEWADLRHQRLFLAIATVTPFVLFLAFYLIWSSDITIPIEVANRAGAAGEPMVRAMESIQTPFGVPYIETRRLPNVTLQPRHPNEYLVEVEILDGQRSIVHYGAENENSVKNYINRLNQAKTALIEEKLGMRPVVLAETDRYRQDIPTRQFMAVGVMGYALLLTGMVFGGVLVAREYEDRTIKLIQVSPAPPGLVLGAKTVTAFGLTLLSGVVYVLLAAGLLTGAWPVLPGTFLVTMLATALVGVLLGSAVGVLVKASVPVFLVALVINLFSWVAGGGFGSIRMFSDTHQVLAQLMPYTHVTQLLQYSYFTGRPSLPVSAGLGLTISVVVALALAGLTQRAILAKGK